MAGHELVTEGFRPGQVGSSAMPHKMNSRSTERINGLTVLLRGYAGMVGELAGAQWNEGDVSDSVVRRVALPDAFFALDGLYETSLTVLDELGAYPAVIARELDRYLPFLATTAVLMAAVRAGRRPGDRARGDQGARRRPSRSRCGRRARPRTTCWPASPPTNASGCPPLDGLLADPLALHRRGVGAGRGGRRAGRRDRRRASRGRRLHPGSDPVKLLHSGKVRDSTRDGDDLSSSPPTASRSTTSCCPRRSRTRARC